jgi:hypothetical protein
VLCGVCQEGYGRSGRFNCKSCPNSTLNQAYLAIGLLVMLVVIFLLTRMTVNNAQSGEPRTVNSILLKILLSAVQLNSLASRFDFQWPSIIQGWLDAQDFVGSASSSFLSVDCFLHDNTTSPFYTKVLIYLLLPIMFIIVCLLFWLGWTTYKARKTSIQERSALWSNMWKEYASCCVVILFLLHPDLTLQGFNVFACKKVLRVSLLRSFCMMIVACPFHSIAWCINGFLLFIE